MLSYALENGFGVLKKNSTIFVPFIMLGIISILSFLIIAKPMFELIYQTPYTTFYLDKSDGYLLKKLTDIILLIITWVIFLFIITIFINVAGLRAVKDYLSEQKTKISGMVKTIVTKGFVAIFGVLAAIILFFFPGIIGILLFFWSLFAQSSYASTISHSIALEGVIGFIVFIMFVIQAIILFAFGYYILSKKFRKFYIMVIFSTIILFILAAVIRPINEALSFVFFIPSLILFIALGFVLLFITLILLISIDYIVPSAIVLNNNINATDAIKRSLNFIKDNTANFSLLVLIWMFIIIIISIPSLLVSFINADRPSFSLFLFGEIFAIALNAIVSPYILSIFALAYAFSLTKEKKGEETEVREKIKEEKGLSGLSSGG